jgi:hypothetical protein
MLSLRRSISGVISISALLAFAYACSGSSFTSGSTGSGGKGKVVAGGTKNNPATTETQSTNNTVTNSAPLPPVEITGSYLTGVLNDPAGEPLADATLEVIATNHSTTTNTAGEFKIPVLKIPSSTFEMKLSNVSRGPDSESSQYTVQTTLPPALAALVDSEKSNTTVKRDMDQAVNWTFPRNMTPVSSAEDSSQKYVLNTLVVPKSVGTLSLGVLTNDNRDLSKTRYSNDSHGGAARFSWNAPADAVVKIGYSTGVNSLASWTGDERVELPSQGPTSSGGTGGIFTVSAFDACDDDGFRTQASGTFTPVNAKCGIKFLSSGSLLNQVDGYYFRISVLVGNKLLLSPIEKAKYSTPTWSLYHTAIESCWPKYFGPSLMLPDGSGIDPTKFGLTQPACTDSLRGQPFCVGQDDGSPSKCLSCETNLFLCL